MAVLTDRIPTLSRTVRTEPAGPRATRPFGLDAVTGPVTVGPGPAVAVDPVSQLSLIDGRVALDVAAVAGTACNTPSDGKDAIAVDHDENDD